MSDASEGPEGPASVAEGEARINTTSDFAELLDELGDECVEDLGARDYDGQDGELPVAVHARVQVTLTDDSPDGGNAGDGDE